MIPSLLGFILFIRGYTRLFLRTKSSKEKFIEMAKSQGCYTEATYVSRRIRYANRYANATSNRNDRYTVKYEYKVNGKIYYKKVLFQSEGSISCGYPLNIVVYFDKNNPRKAYCKEELDYGTHKSLGCFTDIAIAFIAMWFVNNILSYI